MTADEPLGQRAERLARCMDAIARQSTIYNGLDRINAKDAAATLRALAAANAALTAERDAEAQIATEMKAERDAALARAARLEGAINAFFASPMPPGEYQHTSGVMVVGLVAVADLNAALASETGAPA